MLAVGVGSLNPTKIQAVQAVFTHQFVGSMIHNDTGRRVPKIFEKVEVFACEIESIVSATPKSDDECIKGAIYRSKVALQKTKEKFEDAPDLFGVGLEAGISEITHPEDGTIVYLLSVWAAIIHKKSGKISIGCSAKAPFSNSLLKKMKAKAQGTEMKEVLSQLSGVPSLSTKQGGISLLTDGAITRQQLNEQALHCALAPFISPNIIH